MLMSKESFRSMPIPLLKYCGDGKFSSHYKFTTMDSATEYWLIQETLDNYYLKWWGNGWVVYYQESYLTKDLKFSHKNDIPGFLFSNFGDAKEWSNVFETREEAIETYEKYYNHNI